MPKRSRWGKKKENTLAQVVSINVLCAEDITKTTLLDMDSYGDKIDIGYQSNLNPGEDVIIYFYFKFETLDNLKVLNSAKFSGLTNLNDYLDTTFLMPQFVVRLEQLNV